MTKDSPVMQLTVRYNPSRLRAKVTISRGTSPGNLIGSPDRFPAEMSQKRIRPSYDPVIASRPSGVNTPPRTVAGWGNGGLAGLPVATSQTRAELATEWSRQPVVTSSLRPSGLNWTELTRSGCGIG